MKGMDGILTGIETHHLVPWQGGVQLHRDVIEPLTTLCEKAREAGFRLEIASGFRSFDRQLAIWNAKARGERQVLDKQGKPIAVGSLDDEALLWAILQWSALPGTSRHHWGTDMDIWDSAAVDNAYCLKLEVAEYTDNGPFAPLIAWLDGQVEGGTTDFYFPYARYQGGVMPEPWHISYQPLASGFAQRLTADKVAGVIGESPICLKRQILENIEQIMDRFVQSC